MSGMALVAVLIAAPVMATAEEQTAYDAMLTSQARRAADMYAGAACPEAKVQRLSTQVVPIADQPDFAAQIERVKVEGCGRSAVENIRVGRFGGSPPWRMVVALPGESLADMNLQQNAWQQVVSAAAGGIPADCKTVTLGDVYVTARVGHVDIPKPGSSAVIVRGNLRVNPPAAFEAQRDRLDIGRAWAEVWPLTLCGQDRTTTVVFIPIRDQKASIILPLPVWQIIAQRGAGARPEPAP